MITRFKSSLFAHIFATTTAAIIVLFAAMYLLAVPFIQTTVEGIEERSGRTILNNVYAMVEQAHLDLEKYRQSIVLERKAQLRNIITVVDARIKILEEQVRTGKLSKEQARHVLLDELRHIKYGRNDYVFAANYRSVLISHPDPELNGADFSNKRDFRGNLIVPPMVDGALSAGEGFYSYWWRRLGEQQPTEKLSYYKHIPAFDLIVGTGVYLDDVEVAVRNKRDAAVEDLRRRLRETRLAKTGYVFIFDGKMNMLIHPNSNVEGKSVGHMLDPATKTPLLPILMTAADKPENVHYKWDSPSDPNNYVYDKISWMRYFKEFDWYIGTSVYVDELAGSARTLRNRVLAVFAITLLLSVLLIYLFVKKLTDPLRQLRDTALRVESGDFDARCNLSRNDEIGVVATAFNGMVWRLQDNIRHLDTKVSERTAELEKAYEELKELDQLKSDFLSTVSHELRTPMTSVIGFAKLIKKKLEKSIFPLAAEDEKAAHAISQVRENLDIIVEESERLTLMINDVLDSAKLEAGKVEWNFTTVTPLRLIERATAITTPLVEQKGLTLVSEVEPDLPNVRGDENRLLQVLINLVANAVKFTEHGQIALRAERQGEFVRFSVRDSGCGIAEKDQGKVFDKFKQIGDTLTDKPHGTGLGLSICQRIVQHHGGELWLDSTLGEGSIFYVTVPLKETI
ncbi:MAG: cache domain-containing protein [Betaproteobacteria bacterium]|nr:cache domain-containing protein [Betaproteobacteria bacterium]